MGNVYSITRINQALRCSIEYYRVSYVEGKSVMKQLHDIRRIREEIVRNTSWKESVQALPSICMQRLANAMDLLRITTGQPIIMLIGLCQCCLQPFSTATILGKHLLHCLSKRDRIRYKDATYWYHFKVQELWQTIPGTIYYLCWLWMCPWERKTAPTKDTNLAPMLLKH